MLDTTHEPTQNFSFKPKMFTRKKKKKKKKEEEKKVEPASPKAAGPPGAASPTGSHLTNDELVAMLSEGGKAKGSAEKAEVRQS